MGISSSKKTQTTKPIYGSEIEGAAHVANSTYSSQIPKITSITDQLGSLAPDLLKRYTQGEPSVTAAQNYNTDVLEGEYLNAGNPYLGSQIDNTNRSVRNQAQAALGSRGLTNGSAYSDIISRVLAENESGLRYADYNNERNRMDTAAGQAPSLAAASYVPISVLQGIANSQALPAQASSGYASTIGGLLGQYTNVKQTEQESIMDNITKLLAAMPSPAPKNR